MMKPNKYNAVADTLVKIITNLILALAVFLFAMNLMAAHPINHPSFMGLFVLIAIIILMWGIHPLSYTIKSKYIEINRPFGRKRYLRTRIRNLQKINRADLGFSIRLFGSGGFFGYLGICKSSKIGQYMMWCTNREELIMFEYAGKKIVISPENRDRFVSEFLSE